MRTKANPVLFAFMLILLIPDSSSTTNQSSTPEITTSTQASGFTKTGDIQNTTKFQKSSLTSHLNQNFQTGLSMTTTKTKASNISSISPTSPTSTTSPNRETQKIWIVSILFVIIVVMVIVGCVHHICNKDSDQGSSVNRLLLDVRESLRSCIRNLEDQMGVRLWLGDRRGVENTMEEAEEGQSGEGEEWKSDGTGGSSEVSNKGKGELKEEDSNTSDDYSSMEGDNLKERALNRQNGENKDVDAMSSSSDEGQTDAEGKSGRNKSEDSEEMALVTSPQEDDEKADLFDVTAL